MEFGTISRIDDMKRMLIEQIKPIIPWTERDTDWLIVKINTVNNSTIINPAGIQHSINSVMNTAINE